MPINIYNKRLEEIGPKAVQQTSGMIAYWDKDLICRFANQAYLLWFGKNPEDMIDKIHMSELLGPLYEKNLKYIKGALSGEAQVFERMIHTPDGRVRNTRAIYTPDIDNGTVSGFYAYVSDIDPIGFNSDSTVQPGLPHMSIQVEQMLYEVEQELKKSILLKFPGVSILAKHHSVSESKLKRDFKQKHNTSIFNFYRRLQMEQAERYLLEKKYTKSQLAILFNFSNPSNFSACYHRYLEQKEAMHAQHRDLKEQLLYSVIRNQAHLSIAILDNELHFIDASEKWIADHYLQGLEIIGRHIFEVHPLCELHRPEYARSLKGEHFEAEQQSFTKHGAKVWMRWNVAPRHNSEGEIQGLLLITDNITALKEKEEKDQDAEILARSSQISRIGTWTRNFMNNTAFWSRISKEILEVPLDFEPELNKVMSFYKPGSSRDLANSVLNSALKTGKPFDIQVEMLTGKGNVKIIRIIGYPDFRNGLCEKISGTFQEISL